MREALAGHGGSCQGRAHPRSRTRASTKRRRSSPRCGGLPRRRPRAAHPCEETETPTMMKRTAKTPRRPTIGSDPLAAVIPTTPLARARRRRLALAATEGRQAAPKRVPGPRSTFPRRSWTSCAPRWWHSLARRTGSRWPAWRRTPSSGNSSGSRGRRTRASPSRASTGSSWAGGPSGRDAEWLHGAGPPPPRSAAEAPQSGSGQRAIG